MQFIGPASKRPWRALGFELPNHIPTMITREEVQYLRWLTENLWDDSGHVVEMGPWLGGSTYCLASGMRARQASAQHRLHAFDSFEWRDFMAERAPLKLAAGASFEPNFRENLGEFSSLVVTHQAVLPDELLSTDASVAGYRQASVSADASLRWQDGPIQLLFVDGAKSWTGMRHLLTETAPSWIPGKTVVVCQDYKHWECYWVTALAERLARHLRPLHVIQRNTVAFVVESLPTPAELAALPIFADTVLADTLELVEGAAQRLAKLGDRGGADVVRLGKVPFLVHRGQPQLAEREFRARERAWLSLAHERSLVSCRQWLSERIQQPLSEGAVHRVGKVALGLAARAKRSFQPLRGRLAL